MAVTRSVSKGKARAVSPHVSGSLRAAAGRATAARVSIERAALGRAVNAAVSLEDDGRPFQDVTNSQSALTPLVNGAREDGTLMYMRHYIGGRPTVMRSTTTTASITVTEVLYDDEALAAWNGRLAGANSAAAPDPDPDVLMLSRPLSPLRPAAVTGPPSSPLPPASITDTEGVMRFNRREAAREFVAASKNEMSMKFAIEITDAELAAKLQEAEVEAAEAEQRGVGPSRLMTARTPDPATPMDITPNPTPYRTRTAPASPSPATDAAADHTLPSVVPVESALLDATDRAAAAATFTPYVDQPNTQHRVPANVPAHQQRTASQPSASTRPQNPPTYSAAPSGRAARPVAVGTTSRRTTAATSSAQTGSSRLPTYASHAPGPSVFVLPVRPLPRNGFASHETIRTYTTFMEDGTPCISIIDNNDDASEGSSTE